MKTATLYCGDVIDVLGTLPAESIRCCVTSPPYWAFRDYGVDGQLGLEATPEEYVSALSAVFREVRRVLTDDGTLWLNLGDSYAAGGHGGGGSFMDMRGGDGTAQSGAWSHRKDAKGWRRPPLGLKPKDLVGIPWRIAFALQADGWWLRSDIIWAKPNPMPESVTDRPTKAHEYVFLLSKSQRYYYDADAIKRPSADASMARWAQDTDSQLGSDRVPGKTNGRVKAVGGPRKTDKQRGHSRRDAGFNDRWDHMSKSEQRAMGANARTVWTIATRPYSGAHFATFPPELPERCIKAGSAPGDTVLDPFGGSGTTAAVAVGLGRKAIHIDLNPEYIEMARQRIGPMFCSDDCKEVS